MGCIFRFASKNIFRRLDTSLSLKELKKQIAQKSPVSPDIDKLIISDSGQIQLKKEESKLNEHNPGSS